MSSVQLSPETKSIWNCSSELLQHQLTGSFSTSGTIPESDREEPTKLGTENFIRKNNQLLGSSTKPLLKTSDVTKTLAIKNDYDKGTLGTLTDIAQASMRNSSSSEKPPIAPQVIMSTLATGVLSGTLQNLKKPGSFDNKVTGIGEVFGHQNGLSLYSTKDANCSEKDKSNTFVESFDYLSENRTGRQFDLHTRCIAPQKTALAFKATTDLLTKSLLVASITKDMKNSSSDIESFKLVAQTTIFHEDFYFVKTNRSENGFSHISTKSRTEKTNYYRKIECAFRLSKTPRAALGNMLTQHLKLSVPLQETDQITHTETISTSGNDEQRASSITVKGYRRTRYKAICIVIECHAENTDSDLLSEKNHQEKLDEDRDLCEKIQGKIRNKSLEELVHAMKESVD